jgi:hypothetical protein
MKLKKLFIIFTACLFLTAYQSVFSSSDDKLCKDLKRYLPEIMKNIEPLFGVVIYNSNFDKLQPALEEMEKIYTLENFSENVHYKDIEDIVNRLERQGLLISRVINHINKSKEHAHKMWWYAYEINKTNKYAQSFLNTHTNKSRHPKVSELIKMNNKLITLVTKAETLFEKYHNSNAVIQPQELKEGMININDQYFAYFTVHLEIVESEVKYYGSILKKLKVSHTKQEVELVLGMLTDLKDTCSDFLENNVRVNLYVLNKITTMREETWDKMLALTWLSDWDVIIKNLKTEKFP